MIKLENVCFGYENTQTVNDVNFHIKKGEFVALLGDNGAGKSTVAKLIRGLLKPTAGRVIIDGIDTAKVKASSLAAKIGFLFQNPDRQICKNTVIEELKFSLEYTVADKSKHQQLIDQTIKAFALNPDGKLFAMSRGERQQFALASVLISHPDILILDEPTTGLDYRECIHIMDMVKAMNQKGVTVLMVTHDMEIALDYADRILVLHHGRVLADGTPQEIFYRQDVLSQAYLLPPQIVGLSVALDERFGRVYHVEEIAEAVINAKNKGANEQ